MLQWWTDVLDNFDDFEEASRKDIAEFLRVAVADLTLIDDPNPQPAAAEYMGGRDTLAVSRDSVIEANSKKVYVKKVRDDDLYQRNVAEMVLGPENSNPLYTLRILRDGSRLAEVTQRFGPYRDLYTKINADKICDIVLSAPFPVTLKMSALGLKPHQIEDRRAGLQNVCIYVEIIRTLLNNS